MKKYFWLFVLMFILFNINNIFAINCASTISSNTNLNSDLICPNGAININSGILDCQGFSIIGNNTGNGIYINGYSNIQIKNCNILNFSKGIYLKSRPYTIALGWGRIRWSTADSNNIIISNSNFKNNDYGIFSSEGKNLKIFKNNFRNNNLKSIYLTDKSTSIIYENSFYNSTPQIISTSGKSFCYNNISNFYYGENSGPNCNCIPLNNNLIINSNINICKKDYNLKDGIKLLDNSILDCKNSKISGIGLGNGILVTGRNTKINNCIISNYSNGITYSKSHKFDTNGYGYYQNSLYNKISNSKIYNVDIGVYVSSFSFRGRWYDNIVEKISNSSILAKNYNIFNSISKTINASSSFFGSNNSILIESKFLKPNLIIYDKFKSLKVQDYILNKSNLILNENNISFKLEKKFLEFNSNLSLEIQIIKVSNSKIVLDKLINISSNFSKTLDLTYNISLNNSDEINIIFDPNNKLIETNKLNNFIKKFYNEKKLIFINSSLNLKFINDEIISYLTYNLESNYKIINNLTLANIILNIKPKQINSNLSSNLINLNKFNINLPNLYFQKKPYEGKIISTYNLNNKNNNNSKVLVISLIGEDLEGSLALVRELSKNNLKYISQNFSYEVNFNSTNINFIEVYDYLHNFENNKYFKQNNNLFKQVIHNTLFDKKYNIYDYNIKINTSINLSNYILRRIFPQNSKSFRNFIDNNSYPIVLGGGLFSDINTWDILGRELANKGYEVYLIELTGNKFNECKTCYNYNYSFLTNKVLPIYINYILNLSNKSKVKYIGHSNGARVLIDSISNGAINSSYFDTFVGVGVPGAFVGNSYLKFLILNFGVDVNKKIKNDMHISMFDIFALDIFSLKSSQGKISKKLWLKYLSWMNNSQDPQPGINLSFNNFLLISGNYFQNSNDGIVSLNDSLSIFNNIKLNSSNSKYFNGNFIHLGMSEKKDILNEIKSFMEVKN